MYSVGLIGTRVYPASCQLLIDVFTYPYALLFASTLIIFNCTVFYTSCEIEVTNILNNVVQYH